MIRFECDYAEGAHPAVLERLMQTNLEQSPGYGTDEHCAGAASCILELCQAPQAQVHFLVGGTQANRTVIAAALRPHQGVLCADTGHINTHESGAIESSGHKVLSLPSADGKITAAQVRRVCREHAEDATREHTVQPGMVYISSPTELGTLYTRAELEALAEVCREAGVFLYLDGARLGYGLAAPDNDLDLPCIARCCDAFYIGGTKVGALFGEAVVLTQPALQKDFRYFIKQNGGLLAKGRLLGLQFEALMEKGLYKEISRHAIEMAGEIRRALREAGIAFLLETTTNQMFPILTEAQFAALSRRYAFSFWQRVDGERIAVRICTSWATKKEDVRQLVRDIAGLNQP